MDSNIISLLKVPGFRVVDVQISGEEIIVSVRKRSKTARCPRCLERSKTIKDYRPFSKILHLMLCNQKVFLSARKRRFICDCCKKAFTERFSFLPIHARKSIYAQNHALERLADGSFKATSKRVGICYSSLVSLLKKVFTLSSINWEDHFVKGIIRIGLDEHHFGKRNKYVVTIANLLTGKPIHILGNDKKQTIVTFFKNLPDTVKDAIDEVAVDMRDGFIQAVKESLPKTKIVIDHFHLIQDANKRLNEARKIEEDVEEKIKGNRPKRINWRLLVTAKEHLNDRQKAILPIYLSRYPALATFYNCKEEIRNMYKSQSKQEAEEKLKKLIAFMKQSDYIELNLWAKTLIRYQAYILNYFDHKTSNAVTEGLHRKFKLIQRTAYGFRNSEVYVRRIMLACLPFTGVIHYPH